MIKAFKQQVKLLHRFSFLIPFLILLFGDILFWLLKIKCIKKGCKELRWVYSVFKETQSFMTYVRKSKLDQKMDKVNS